jgi:type IV conjugative transfer system lipoprotein TraV
LSRKKNRSKNGGGKTVKPTFVPIVVLLMGGVLSACAVKYGCPAPDGVSCKPISEVYRDGETLKDGGARLEASSLKPQTSNAPAPDPRTSVSSVQPLDASSLHPQTSSAHASVPLRSAPKILRVWVAPWIDEDGDLHQENFLYLVVDQGTWAMGLPEIKAEPLSMQLIGPNQDEKLTEPLDSPRPTTPFVEERAMPAQKREEEDGEK